jgi:ABC-type multidrug transport system fused ATPase/permease subunit
MEEKATIAESIVEHAKEYAKASLDLIKLQAVNKGSEVASIILSYIIVIATLLMFIMIVNIAVAIWLGDLLGKLYYGFFIVAGFYLVVSFIVYVGYKVLIKKPINNLAIRTYLKHK